MEFTYHPTTFLDAEVSLFENVYSTTPMKTITYRDWIFNKDKTLISKVNRIRTEGNKDLKLKLPCISGSGVMSDRRADKNLKHHNGCIVLDIDYKENLHIKEEDFLQLKKKVFRDINEICYAGYSVGGKGYYLIIRIENPHRHKEYFDYLSNWFIDSEDIKIDESGKNLGRLRFYSVDDNPYINEGATILKESLLGDVKKPRVAIPNRSIDKHDLTMLVEEIEASGISIAPSYDEYLQLAIVFANEQGEDGRDLFHRVCSLDPKYNSRDCDKQFTEVSERGYTDCKIGTLIHLMNKYNVTR